MIVGWRRADDGSAVLGVVPMITVATLVAVVFFDLLIYLAAVSKAQAAADAASLAAVVVSDPRGQTSGSPRRVAEQVATAHGATLISCDCAVGNRVASVEVERAVHTLVVNWFAAGVVRAKAQATLVPP